MSLFGLVQHSNAAAAVVTQGLRLGQGLGSVTSPCLSADSMAIVLQMLVRGQGQNQGSSGSGGSDGNSDCRLVIDLFDLYLKQHNQLQQQQQQQQAEAHVHANNDRDASPSRSSGPSPSLPAKLFSPVLQALAHLQEYDLMLSLLQVIDIDMDIYCFLICHVLPPARINVACLSEQ